MGRVSTCQKNCNTIDLRRAQVNDWPWLLKCSSVRESKMMNAVARAQLTIHVSLAGPNISRHRLMLALLQKYVYRQNQC